MNTTMAWSRSWQICVLCRRLAVHSSGFGKSARTKRGRFPGLPPAVGGDAAAAEAEGRAATCRNAGCVWRLGRRLIASLPPIQAHTQRRKP